MNGEVKKKGKFNAIDAFIILLVIACILSVVYRYLMLEEISVDATLKEYVIHFKVGEVSGTSLKYFKAGDTFRIKSSEMRLGTLDGIQQHVPAVGAYNKNGSKIYYPQLEDETIYNTSYYSAVGYVTVKGKMTDEGFLLNGSLYLTANDELQVVSEHIETTIKVVSITEK